MEIRTNIKISNNITEVSNIAEKPNHVEKHEKCMEEAKVLERECKLIKLYEEDDKIFPVSSDESLFWGMHLKRKAVIENMNENIENLVKECLYWKQQLNALEDSNRILKNEKQSLLREYEELLEKTRHDDNIVLKLKNSEKELQKEEVEGLQLNRKIRTAASVKNLLSNDKSALEKKRNALIRTLETHNKKLEQINHDHELLQKKIEKQYEIAENNRKNREKNLQHVEHAITRLENFLRIFNDNYSYRDEIVESIQTIKSNGLKFTLMESSEVSENSKISVSESETYVSVKETSEDHFSSADEDFSETDNPTTSVMSDAFTDKRIEDIDQYQKGQSNSEINERALQIAKEENRFLLETYSWLNGKLGEWSNRQLQLRNQCSAVQSTNKKLVSKSLELEKLVHATKRNFKLPQRNPELELGTRIQEERNKNEALSDLLTECLSFKDENNKMNALFRENILQIYKSHLSKPNTTTEPKRAEETKIIQPE